MVLLTEMRPFLGSLQSLRGIRATSSTRIITRSLSQQPATPSLQSFARLPTPKASIQSQIAGKDKVAPRSMLRLFSTSFPRQVQPAAASPTTSQSESSSSESTTSSNSVAYHLFFCAGLVYLIIVVGGLTRLTESGLSITEWNPGFKGMSLPWTDAEWDAEWEKYKQTPEWAILNRHMTVEDFKKIYMWEWSHRIIGRFIGVAFLLPTVYFLARGKVAKGTKWKLLAIALGIGFQGALGWFMVKSGLTAPESTPPVIAQQHPNTTVSAGAKELRLDGSVSQDSQSSASSDWHPRVSHFRLAAHLGTAFLVYMGMLHTGMSILRDNKLVNGKGKAAGWMMNVGENVQKLVSAMQNPRINRFRNVSRGMLCLAFITSMSGALVAGLDAGLVYNEFPYMGEGIVPPKEELLEQKYAWHGKNDKDEAGLVFGNMTQNPVTVQLMHRTLAVTTLISAIGLGFYARRVSRSMITSVKMPPAIPRVASLVSLAAITQASLGISTLIYLVPIELASAHQAGSVALLTAITALLAVLRSPNKRILQKLANQSSPIARQAIIARALQKVSK
ncbi:COX15-CtaA-domain-containing protein [Meira miltonrushii]|uniref:COX15-CtaA-domain-containing protein n=1 Tax=Meira miltonrushii TaxID=1280837 RepID=A0A316V8Z1_9BASI|nr:COX15-CtaA-domain-containing protein [Meira miltonrushii]PWN34069.1 COX15-CtaA-domain-containing protein [Meira miltonrushii]